MSEATTTILVADDHPMFRSALVHALGTAIGGCRVLEASSQSTLEACLGTEPDIDLVLLDLMMPGAIGFSSLLWLRAERPDLPVIVISSDDRPRTVRGRSSEEITITGTSGRSARSHSSEEKPIAPGMVRSSSTRSISGVVARQASSVLWLEASSTRQAWIAA